MKDGSLLQEHISLILISRLIAPDVKIDDNEKIFLLFCSIHDSRNGLIMNFDNIKDLTMESICFYVTF